MSSNKAKSNSELENPLKDRIKVLMTPDELEKPYSFATRVGLSKGTFTGIWVEGRKSFHQTTVEKICKATGANPGWLVTGIGEPFTDVVPVVQQEQTTLVEPQIIEEEGLKITTAIDKAMLQTALETTEKKLREQHLTMQPKPKAEFILMLYEILIDQEKQPYNKQLLNDVIYEVEECLERLHKMMLVDKKTLLIIAIYTLYSVNSQDKDGIRQTVTDIIRKAA
ncbi:hypothetical protein [Acinetobacter tjernbergiae]|uniref:Uncharacterized protein n=1 Tax=Acinetobacter tjernbergiae DSM 14971 = CIP 107465 TaxID=1120928 RepID=V2V9M2_9GAMM|nr:hypothetical protein [Acinetobacter tjernbergiae]ESK57561.1 hypothetical protein F990_00097 [Acinetobacter tjernbergiae DSM 14971 = CIP 107465]